MDVRVRKLAARQCEVVAAWQLVGLGWSRDRISHWSNRQGWQVMHAGVYLLANGEPTRAQRWMAAALSHEESVLSHASAAACWGMRPWERAFEVVTRPGSGGPMRFGSLLVCRSILLSGETTTCQGIPITTPARTLIDLAAELHRGATARAFREGIRVRVLEVREFVAALDRHRGRRGTRCLWDLAESYSGLPYTRTRSNAEARALEILHDADLLPDRINTRIAGEEADLIWLETRLIVEIDGPQFHQFRDEDERKKAVWEGAGFTVRRIGSQAVYDDPASLIAVVAT